MFEAGLGLASFALFKFRSELKRILLPSGDQSISSANAVVLWVRAVRFVPSALTIHTLLEVFAGLLLLAS